MPTYFFDLHECGIATLGTESLELNDDDAALSFALEAARDLMGEEVRLGKLCLSCYIDIRRDTGTVSRLLFRDAIVVTGI